MPHFSSHILVQCTQTRPKWEAENWHMAKPNTKEFSLPNCWCFKSVSKEQCACSRLPKIKEKNNNNKHHKHKTWGGKMKVPDVKVWELKENLKMWAKMTNSSRQEGENENDHNPIPYLIIEGFYIQCLKCIGHRYWEESLSYMNLLQTLFYL